MQFWLKLGASRRLETFIETKCKVCYTIENLSLSIDEIFFLYGVLKFSAKSCFTWTAMWDHGSKYAIMRDQVWMNVVLRANFQRSVKTPNLDQF